MSDWIISESDHQLLPPDARGEPEYCLICDWPLSECNGHEREEEE